MAGVQRSLRRHAERPEISGKHSQKQAAYPNGTVLQMTGKCTGGVDLLDISTQPEWKQEQLVRYRWCQLWHDPAQNGNFVTGWGLRQAYHPILTAANLSRSPGANRPYRLVASLLTGYLTGEA